MLDTLRVVAHNLDMWMSAVEFAVDFGSNDHLLYLQDIHLDNTLYLGTSYGGYVDGVTITYLTPIRAVGPTVVMRILVLWTCNDCDELSPRDRTQWIRVSPHEYFGSIRALRWPDDQMVDMVGWTSLVCSPSFAVEETTWGRVKALYR